MRGPWWLKIGAKLVLARLPVPYAAWRHLSLFRHGSMDDAAYVITTFSRHLERSGIERHAGGSVLELGPGDSVGSAVVAAALVGGRTYLVDVGAFARTDAAPYRAIAEALKRQGLTAPDIGTSATLPEILEACRATYLTDGLRSLRSIESNSVDFIWSQAVLEHIEKGEFQETIRELARVLRPNGVMSHRIDFQDHLEESLNNLRFSDSVWESALFHRSGFYTNRLRLSQVLDAFRSAGLTPETPTTETWPSLPINRPALHPQFRRIDDRDLLVRWADILAQHKRTDARAL